MTFVMMQETNSEISSPSLFSPPYTAHSSTVPPSPASSSSRDHDTISVSSEVSATSATSSAISVGSFSLPTRWKPNIMCAITRKKLNPEVRNELVRDIVTHIYGTVDKPNPALIAKVARSLVQRYPFMADSVLSPGCTIFVSVILIKLFGV